ncbi:MAG: redox-sensing transcriptional repressor Rex [Clostridiales bacterium]|nr:redox-sensing transcriptional repressor Rex [Clostridiales bacterium]
MNMSYNGISTAILQRLPIYLGYLKALPDGAPDNISATAIAAALGTGEVQVRKDLASVSNAGKPKIGYITADLIDELEEFLGYKDTNDAVLVGAGRLGRALLEYEGFKAYGLNIVMAFDVDERATGKTSTGKSVFPLSKLENLCKRMNVKIGIITVPASAAQGVCDLMIKNGILAIWNFAPVHLDVPSNILVRSENMAASLAMLSGHLAKKLFDK